MALPSLASRRRAPRMQRARALRGEDVVRYELMRVPMCGGCARVPPTTLVLCHMYGGDRACGLRERSAERCQAVEEIRNRLDDAGRAIGEAFGLVAAS